MKTRYLLLGAAMLAMTAAPAMAQVTASQPLTVNASVTASAVLTLSTAAISFPNADPDATPVINANTPVDVTAKARATAGQQVTLTVVASGDLTTTAGTGASIGIANVKWTSATGSGFLASGTMSTTAQSVAAWSNSGNRNGTLAFTLDNSWNYAVGSYTTGATFTLSAQ